jgi:hypothetical protein
MCFCTLKKVPPPSPPLKFKFKLKGLFLVLVLVLDRTPAYTAAGLVEHNQVKVSQLHR